MLQSAREELLSKDFLENGLPLTQCALSGAALGGFVGGTGLADAFEGNCPATFRAEYLPAGATPRCIDFILTADGVKAEAATVVFAAMEPLPSGSAYVSDHVGLRASLFLTPP